MRSINELLKVVLASSSYFKNSYGRGLCQWVDSLYLHDNAITNEERNSLLTYIRKNRPSKYSSLSAYMYAEHDYYWKPSARRHRIKWLKKHIKLTA